VRAQHKRLVVLYHLHHIGTATADLRRRKRRRESAREGIPEVVLAPAPPANQRGFSL
jgi:hypothetical protein